MPHDRRQQRPHRALLGAGEGAYSRERCHEAVAQHRDALPRVVLLSDLLGVAVVHLGRGLATATGTRALGALLCVDLRAHLGRPRGLVAPTHVLALHSLGDVHAFLRRRLAQRAGGRGEDDKLERRKRRNLGAVAVERRGEERQHLCCGERAHTVDGDGSAVSVLDRRRGAHSVDQRRDGAACALAEDVNVAPDALLTLQVCDQRLRRLFGQERAADRSDAAGDGGSQAPHDAAPQRNALDV
mmetsp:Transcript_16451/g.57501  ORF Transcript_16451/g.57501 Transcript_16451/m.57501 type:complete len:242 (-) Transcript_16451:2740-3465(-)